MSSQCYKPSKTKENLQESGRKVGVDVTTDAGRLSICGAAGSGFELQICQELLNFYCSLVLELHKEQRGSFGHFSSLPCIQGGAFVTALVGKVHKIVPTVS